MAKIIFGPFLNHPVAPFSVAFNNQSYIDGMEEQLSALGLVTNAVIYWNTRYLKIIIDQMKLEGYECSDEMIAKLSPLMHEHINFVGKYSFKYDPALNEGNMRPLNI